MPRKHPRPKARKMLAQKRDRIARKTAKQIAKTPRYVVVVPNDRVPQVTAFVAAALGKFSKRR
ncbi:hypothetical protein [Marivivens aquimaris]|uniref:hypothetical protein n=1 Tax=Marivivens aquimaris TaxID=2774876 RepID=UPI001881BA2B|nr:hypothetical protein [Marivivens aquimaris]